MNTFASSILAAALVFLGGAVSGCNSTATLQSSAALDRSASLQVTVHVPISMSLLRDDYVEEAFAHRVATALHEQGFRGRIRYIDFPDDLVSNVPSLDIVLQEWRVDRIGSVDCVFFATLRTPQGSHDLGLFSGTSFMMWPRRDWWARAEGFEDAARDALGNLGDRIRRTGLLPDVAGPVELRSLSLSNVSSSG